MAEEVSTDEVSIIDLGWFMYRLLSPDNICSIALYTNLSIKLNL